MAIKLFANYEHGKIGIMDTPWGFATLGVSHPFPLAAGALAKMGFIKESRGPEGHYSVLWGQAS